jgi:hypothetical protein
VWIDDKSIPLIFFRNYLLIRHITRLYWWWRLWKRMDHSMKHRNLKSFFSFFFLCRSYVPPADKHLIRVLFSSVMTFSLSSTTCLILFTVFVHSWFILSLLKKLLFLLLFLVMSIYIEYKRRASRKSLLHDDQKRINLVVSVCRVNEGS